MTRQRIEETLRAVYRPGKTLRRLLADFLQAGCGSSELSGISICMRPESPWHDRGSALPLIVAQEAEETDGNDCRHCPLFGHPDPSLSRLPCDPGLVVPIRYRSHTVGLVARKEALSAPRKLRPIYETIAARLAHLAQRQELGRRARERLGRELWLLGTSNALARVDEFLEQAAPVGLPVLIRGERGTGREEVTRALHLLSERRDRDFVKIDVSVARSRDLLGLLRERVEDAAGGTVFLAAVDEMDGALQSELADLLRNEWAGDVRVAASARPLDPDGRDERLHPSLCEELGFLEITIAPLRDRREDIRHLVHHFLEHYTGAQAELDGGVLELLEAYPWPGNIPELRQMVGRLTALARGRSIGCEDFRSLQPLPPEGRACERPLRSLPTTVANAPRAILRRETIRLCAAGRSSSVLVEAGRLHPALGRSIDHVGAHVADKLTISELAHRAHVSSSHLSHLFREMLDTSAVSFLNAVRVERAKEALAEKVDLTVTEIAWQVGFGDLRHFERVFRSLVGSTPSVFRSRLAPG